MVVLEEVIGTLRGMIVGAERSGSTCQKLITSISGFATFHGSPQSQYFLQLKVFRSLVRNPWLEVTLLLDLANICKLAFSLSPPARCPEIEPILSALWRTSRLYRRHFGGASARRAPMVSAYRK